GGRLAAVRYHRRLGRPEGDARFLARAPLHVGAQRLILLRDIEFDDFRNARGLREDQLGAARRDVADQAVDHRPPIVEIDAALQEALLTRRVPPLGLALAHEGSPGL